MRRGLAVLFLSLATCSGDDGSGGSGTDAATDAATDGPGTGDTSGTTASSSGATTTGGTTSSTASSGTSGTSTATGTGSGGTDTGSSDTGTSSSTGGTGSPGATSGGAACYPDDTASSTPAEFTDVRLPFFRGQICTVDRVPPGADIPMTFRPCVHPCMTPGTHHRLRYDNCVAGACDGWFILWFDTTSGTGCPADAYARFDATQCVYAPVVNDGFLAQTEGGNDVTAGTLMGIVPYMSNADIIEVDDYDVTMGGVRGLLDIVEAKTSACVPTDDRVFNWTIDAHAPAPPADCETDPACTCRDVGFAP